LSETTSLPNAAYPRAAQARLTRFGRLSGSHLDLIPSSKRSNSYEFENGSVLACRAPLRDWSAPCCLTCNGVRRADTLRSGVVHGSVLACRAPLRDWSAPCCLTCNGVRRADTLRSGVVHGSVLACRAPLRDWSAPCCLTCNGVRRADTLRRGRSRRGPHGTPTVTLAKEGDGPSPTGAPREKEKSPAVEPAGLGNE